MATAQQIRDLITQTTSGSVRLRVPCEVRDEVCHYAARRRRAEEPLREPIGTWHSGRSTPLLADRIGQARGGGASGLPRRGGSAGDPEAGGRYTRARRQVSGIT